MSTVFSESSAGPDMIEVLFPRVVNGKILSSEDAWKHYRNTGEHLGRFFDSGVASEMGERIHRQQEQDSLIESLLRSLKF